MQRIKVDSAFLRDGSKEVRENYGNKWLFLKSKRFTFLDVPEIISENLFQIP